MTAIPLDFSGDPPVAIVNDERLDIAALDGAFSAARSALCREVTRRKEYADRAKTEDVFRRLYGPTIREVDFGGRLILASLWPSSHRERWPMGLDPATGGRVDLEFRKMPASPWGPIWMRPSGRTRTAHCWTGGPTWACGKTLPIEYPGHRTMVTADAYSAFTRSLSLPAAPHCPKCEVAS